MDKGLIANRKYYLPIDLKVLFFAVDKRQGAECVPEQWVVDLRRLLAGRKQQPEFKILKAV